VDEIVMQMGRADYRLAHWMRAILPTIDLADMPLTGFKPLPGTIGGILADGSNAVYDWGEPERLLDHAPEQLAALRKRKRSDKPQASGRVRCRAIVGQAKTQKRRCARYAHEKAGVEEGWLPGMCPLHRETGKSELGPGEQWSAEWEEQEHAAAEAGAAAGATGGAAVGGAAAAAGGAAGGAAGVAAGAADAHAIGPIEIDASDLAALDAAGFVIGVAEAEEEEEEEEEEEAEET
jgi:hypothetical protein